MSGDMKRKIDETEGTSSINDVGASPILPRRLFHENESESDSDTEIIFSTQAQKKRKMSGDKALRLWLTKEFDTRLGNLATKN